MKHRLILTIIAIVAIVAILISGFFLFNNGGYSPLAIMLTLAINFVFAISDRQKPREDKRICKRKPRLKNLFFVIPILFILVNYILLGASYYIQNYSHTLIAWDVAIWISDISLLIIIACLIARITFICIKKINGVEFLIWFFMNLIAVFFLMGVIFDRI